MCKFVCLFKKSNTHYHQTVSASIDASIENNKLEAFAIKLPPQGAHKEHSCPPPFKVNLFFAAFQFQDYLGDHSLLSVGCLNCFSPLSQTSVGPLRTRAVDFRCQLVTWSLALDQRMMFLPNIQKVWVNYVIFFSLLHVLFICLY